MASRAKGTRAFRDGDGQGPRGGGPVGASGNVRSYIADSGNALSTKRPRWGGRDTVGGGPGQSPVSHERGRGRPRPRRASRRRRRRCRCAGARLEGVSPRRAAALMAAAATGSRAGNTKPSVSPAKTAANTESNTQQPHVDARTMVPTAKSRLSGGAPGRRLPRGAFGWKSSRRAGAVRLDLGASSGRTAPPRRLERGHRRPCPGAWKARALKGRSGPRAGTTTTPTS